MTNFKISGEQRDDLIRSLNEAAKQFAFLAEYEERKKLPPGTERTSWQEKKILEAGINDPFARTCDDAIKDLQSLLSRGRLPETIWRR